MLDQLLFQQNIGHNIGIDYSLGVRWRPFLIDNVIISAGLAGLQLGSGLKDVYSTSTFTFGAGGLERSKSAPYDFVYSAFLGITLAY